MTVDSIRSTTDDRTAGLLRLLLAMVFLMTGVMKLLVPVLADAWSGQLLAANLPFYTLSRWSVPFVEIAVGAALAAGVFARVASVVVMAIMVVATYVHVVVDNPSLFPLQPSEPIVPLVVMAVAAFVIWRGAGAWSMDLRASSER